MSERRPPPPRLALRPDEAAQSIGVSLSYFYREVLPELRVVKRGTDRKALVLVSVRELDRWLDANSGLLFLDRDVR